MPKIFEAFGFIFYFWANEYSDGKPEPVHVHFTDGEPSPRAPKIWINGDGRVAPDEKSLDKVTQRDLSKALQIITCI